MSGAQDPVRYLWIRPRGFMRSTGRRESKVIIRYLVVQDEVEFCLATLGELGVASLATVPSSTLQRFAESTAECCHFKLDLTFYALIMKYEDYTVLFLGIRNPVVLQNPATENVLSPWELTDMQYQAAAMAARVALSANVPQMSHIQQLIDSHAPNHRSASCATEDSLALVAQILGRYVLSLPLPFNPPAHLFDEMMMMMTIPRTSLIGLLASSEKEKEEESHQDQMTTTTFESEQQLVHPKFSFVARAAPYALVPNYKHVLAKRVQAVLEHLSSKAESPHDVKMVNYFYPSSVDHSNSYTEAFAADDMYQHRLGTWITLVPALGTPLKLHANGLPLLPSSTVYYPTRHILDEIAAKVTSFISAHQQQPSKKNDNWTQYVQVLGREPPPPPNHDVGLTVKDFEFLESNLATVIHALAPPWLEALFIREWMRSPPATTWFNSTLRAQMTSFTAQGRDLLASFLFFCVTARLYPNMTTMSRVAALMQAYKITSSDDGNHLVTNETITILNARLAHQIYPMTPSFLAAEQVTPVEQCLITHLRLLLACALPLAPDGKDTVTSANRYVYLYAQQRLGAPMLTQTNVNGVNNPAFLSVVRGYTDHMNDSFIPVVDKWADFWSNALFMSLHEYRMLPPSSTGSDTEVQRQSALTTNLGLASNTNVLFPSMTRSHTASSLLLAIQGSLRVNAYTRSHVLNAGLRLAPEDMAAFGSTFLWSMLDPAVILHPQAHRQFVRYYAQKYAAMVRFRYNHQVTVRFMGYLLDTLQAYYRTGHVLLMDHLRQGEQEPEQLKVEVAYLADQERRNLVRYDALGSIEKDSLAAQLTPVLGALRGRMVAYLQQLFTEIVQAYFGALNMPALERSEHAELLADLKQHIEIRYSQYGARPMPPTLLRYLPLNSTVYYFPPDLTLATLAQLGTWSDMNVLLAAT